LHRHMHNEMQNLEIVAQSLADFPDEPWELRMEMARQCWDEARHCALCHRRLKEVGGRKGEFPVMNYEWGVVCLQDTLVARMALQNRTFEGGEMDLLRELSNIWRDHGDIETSELLDGMLADEVQHVRYANAWFKRIAKENPSVLLKLAEAVSYLSKVTAALMPEDDEVNAVGVPLKGWTHLEVFTNVEDRLLAGFTEREIEELRRQEKQGAGPAVAAATG
jgi:uncharacterized ferritin-like protein (DUF455 family)